MKLTPRFVAETLETYLPGLLSSPTAENQATESSDTLDEPFHNITSDSRKVQPGSLFVALKGEIFDGHDFIEKACAQGATGVICRKDFHAPVFKSVKLFSVDDTLAAYRRLAARWRSLSDAPVVGVAGSVGKTTTKELLGSLLQGRWPKVLKTTGSQNGFIGIPMTLLELRADQGAAVIEIGIDEIGAMIQHLELVRPNLSVLTAIGPEHLEKLKDLPTVAAEEAIALTETFAQGGSVVINLDDPWIAPLLEQFLATTPLKAGVESRIFGFTLGVPRTPNPVPAELPLLTGMLREGGIEVQGMGLTKAFFPLPLPGKHNAQNLLAALCVARALGLQEQELQAGLAQFKGATGRTEVRAWKERLVLCDYYNANPTSVEAGLRTLTELATPAHRARWACLGDMLELGPEQEKLHRDLANAICELKVPQILLLGERMRWLQDELQQRKILGQFQGVARHFGSHSALAETLIQEVGPQDALIIKGSRGMKMEEVWKLLEKTSST